MNALATVISDRYRLTAAEDPDTLHGLLYIVEQGVDMKALCKLVHSRSLDRVLDQARAGRLDRVAAFKGESSNPHGSTLEDGAVLPLKWQREIVALLLRPDGSTSQEILRTLKDCGTPGYDAGKAISIIRRDLKPYRVKVDGEHVPGSHNHHFRITGMHAWRMQGLIANGWSP